MNKMNKITKATIIVSIIRIFDMITTYFLINKFGILAEANILIRLQIDWVNSIWLGLLIHYIWSVILIYFGFVLIDYLDKKRRKNKNKKKINLFKRSFWAFVIIFSLIPIWNLLFLLILTP